MQGLPCSALADGLALALALALAPLVAAAPLPRILAPRLRPLRACGGKGAHSKGFNTEDQSKQTLDNNKI